MNFKIFYIILILVLSLACNSSKENCLEQESGSPIISTIQLQPKKSLDVNKIKKIIERSGIFLNFYYGVNNLFGKDYFIFCDKADSLVFFELSSKSVRKVKLPSTLKPHRDICNALPLKNELVVYKTEINKLFFFSIDTTFQIHEGKQYDFQRQIAKNEIVNDDFQATNFYYNKPYLFLNYLKRPALNFIDRKAITYFSIDSASYTQKKAICYPVNYHAERVFHQDILFAPLNDTVLAYCFIDSENIGLFNINTGISHTSKIRHDCSFYEV